MSSPVQILVEQIQRHLQMGNVNNLANQVTEFFHANDLGGAQQLQVVQVLMQHGQWVPALQVLEQITIKDSNGLMMLAMCLEQVGNSRKAVEALLSCLNAGDKRPIIHRLLSSNLAKLRDLDSAIREFDIYLQGIQPQVSDYLQAVDLRLLGRKLEAARSALDQAKALAGDAMPVAGKVLEAKVLRLEKQGQQSLALAQQVVAEDAKLAESWSIIAELASEQGLSESITALEQSLASQVGTDYNSVSRRYSLAKMYDRVGRIDDAYAGFCDANAAQLQALVAQKQVFDEHQLQALTERNMQLVAEAPLAAADFTPVFIVGLPRTGSTLVERVLSQNPAVQALGENERFLLLANELLAVNKNAGGAIAWADLNVLAQQYLPRKPVGSHVVNKLLHNVFYVRLILAVFPNAKIIQMRRSYEDVAWSIFKNYFPAGHNYACDFDHIKLYYTKVNALMDHWGSRYPEAVRDVCYESVVANPDEELAKVFEFLGLPWDAGYKDFYRDAQPSFTFSEAQVQKEINSSGVDAWRKYEAHLAPVFGLR